MSDALQASYKDRLRAIVDARAEQKAMLEDDYKWRREHNLLGRVVWQMVLYSREQRFSDAAAKVVAGALEREAVATHWLERVVNKPAEIGDIGGVRGDRELTMYALQRAGCDSEDSCVMLAEAIMLFLHRPADIMSFPYIPQAEAGEKDAMDAALGGAKGARVGLSEFSKKEADMARGEVDSAAGGALAVLDGMGVLRKYEASEGSRSPPTTGRDLPATARSGASGPGPARTPAAAASAAAATPGGKVAAGAAGAAGAPSTPGGAAPAGARAAAAATAAAAGAAAVTLTAADAGSKRDVSGNVKSAMLSAFGDQGEPEPVEQDMELAKLNAADRRRVDRALMQINRAKDGKLVVGARGVEVRIPFAGGAPVNGEAYDVGLVYGRIYSSEMAKMLVSRVPVDASNGAWTVGEQTFYSERVALCSGCPVYYVGYWTKGLPNGKGKAMYGERNAWNAYSTDGTYSMGYLHGQCHIRYQDGSSYAGTCVRDILHGGGTWVTIVDGASPALLRATADRDAEQAIVANAKDDAPENDAGVLMRAYIAARAPADAAAAANASAKRRRARRRGSLKSTKSKEGEEGGDARTSDEIVKFGNEQVAKAAEAKQRKKELLEKKLQVELHWNDPKLYDPMDDDAAEDADDEAARLRREGNWVDCRKKYGVLYEEYTGDIDRGHREGEGTLRMCDASEYTGYFHRGKPHGKGRARYASGNVYKGDFVRGVRHGVGALFYADGVAHLGEFWKDAPHGAGERSFPNGDKIVGTWRNGMKHGRLSLRYSNGDRREGEWQNGYLRRWLCKRITRLITNSFVAYLLARFDNLVSVVASNAYERYRVMASGEMCERVPDGVDDMDARVVPVIELVGRELDKVTYNEAVTRLEKDIRRYRGEIRDAEKVVEGAELGLDLARNDAASAALLVRANAALFHAAEAKHGEDNKALSAERYEWERHAEAHTAILPDCVRRMRNVDLTQAMCFLRPPPALQWVLSALFMVVMGSPNAPDEYEDVRAAMMTSGAKRTSDCMAYARKVAEYDPKAMEDDVASAVKELYLDDPAFSRDAIRATQPHDDGITAIMAAIAGWVRAAVEAKLAWDESARRVAFIRHAKQLAEAAERAWKREQGVLAGVHAKFLAAEKDVHMARIRLRVITQDMKEAVKILADGSALEAEKGKVFIVASNAMKDDILEEVAGGDLKKLVEMIGRAKGLSDTKARIIAGSDAKVAKNTEIRNRIQKMSIDKLEASRQPAWLEARKTILAVEPAQWVELAETGYEPPLPIVAVGRAFGALMCKKATWQRCQMFITSNVIGGQVDFRSVFIRVVNPDLRRMLEEFNPDKIDFFDVHACQKVIAESKLAVDDYRVGSRHSDCVFAAAAAIARFVLAVCQYVDIGRQLNPMSIRVEQLDDENARLGEKRKDDVVALEGLQREYERLNTIHVEYVASKEGLNLVDARMPDEEPSA